MELRQIAIFRSIAEEKHFGRAARRLYLSQAAVSAALQKLEAELGVKLVHRTSRHVELTAAGRVLLAETTAVEATLERAVRLTREASIHPAGTVRIATNYPASRLLLLPLLERLRREAPLLTTALREVGTLEQLRALAAFELDVGLLYGPVRHPDIATLTLLRVPVVANVRAGHPLADAEAATFAQIARYPYLTGRAGGSPAIEAAVTSAASADGVRLRNEVSGVDAESFLLQIETTDSVGFSSLPRGLQNQANGLRMLKLEPAEPMLEIHVAWNRHRDERSVKSIVEALAALAASMPDTGQ